MSRCCTGSALPALPLSRPPCQQGSRRLLAPPGSITKASTERVASEPSLSPNSQGHQQSGRLKVIGCIGACVDADVRGALAGKRQPWHQQSLAEPCGALQAAVERFETVAGRSAMIGFLVAAVSELLIARPGQAALFQPADAHTLQSLGPAAALLVAFAAVRTLLQAPPLLLVCAP